MKTTKLFTSSLRGLACREGTQIDMAFHYFNSAPTEKILCVFVHNDFVLFSFAQRADITIHLSCIILAWMRVCFIQNQTHE